MNKDDRTLARLEKAEQYAKKQAGGGGTYAEHAELYLKAAHDIDLADAASSFALSFAGKRFFS